MDGGVGVGEEEIGCSSKKLRKLHFTYLYFALLHKTFFFLLREQKV